MTLLKTVNCLLEVMERACNLSRKAYGKVKVAASGEKIVLEKVHHLKVRILYQENVQ